MPLSAALAVLATWSACRLSLVSCLSSLRESLPSGPDAYGQSLKALPSQLAASGNESRIPGVVSECYYSEHPLVKHTSPVYHPHGAQQAL
ncbi:hypothetical protein Tco_1167701 [Tanacetum coccineum]